jgi:hypothetical protein
VRTLMPSRAAISSDFTNRGDGSMVARLGGQRNISFSLVFSGPQRGMPSATNAAMSTRLGSPKLPWRAAARFFRAISANLDSRSISRARRPVSTAATPSEPPPAKGSKTRASRAVNSFKNHATNSTGLAVGWPSGVRALGIRKNLSQAPNAGSSRTTFEGYRPSASGSNGACAAALTSRLGL